MLWPCGLILFKIKNKNNGNMFEGSNSGYWLTITHGNRLKPH